MTATTTDTDQCYAPGVREQQLNPDGKHSILIATLNTLLSAAAAQRADAGRFAHVTAAQAPGSAAVWGTDALLSAERAALINGAAAHQFAFDDTSDVLLGHPSVVLVPAILGSKNADQLSTTDFLCAYAAGYETMTRLAARMNPEHYRIGFHATATLGTVAAAHAVSHASGHDVPTRAAAVGIACGRAAGLRVNIGHPMRQWHAGLAAGEGLLATELAELGIRPAGDSVEGTHGLLATMCRQPAPRLAWDDSDPAINGRYPLNLKSVPGCGAVAPGVAATLAGLKQLRVTAEDVAVVHAVVNPFVLEVVDDGWPATAEEAGFSLRFALAVALAYGELRPWHLSTPEVHSSRLRKLAERIEISAADLGPTKYESAITLRTNDQAETTIQRGGVGGTPATAYSPEDVVKRWAGFWAPEALPALVNAGDKFVNGAEPLLADRLAALLGAIPHEQRETAGVFQSTN